MVALAVLVTVLAVALLAYDNHRLRKKQQPLLDNLVQLRDLVAELSRRLHDHITANEQLQKERDGWIELVYEASSEHSNLQAWLLRDLERISVATKQPIDPQLVELVTGYRRKYVDESPRAPRAGDTEETPKGGRA
jgi:hypothetical protein